MLGENPFVGHSSSVPPSPRQLLTRLAVWGTLAVVLTLLVTRGFDAVVYAWRSLTSLGIDVRSVVLGLAGMLGVWLAFRITQAVFRGSSFGQGAALVACLLWMTEMAAPTPQMNPTEPPWTFATGLVRALPGLVLAFILASRSTSEYFEDLRAPRSEVGNRVN